MDFDVLKAGDIDPTLGKSIKEVILTSNTFIVYIDANDVIQWSTQDHNQWGENFGKIQNEVSYWESISNKLFNKRDSYDCKCLLAEAYARILDEGNDNSAQEIINETINRIKIQGKEILRQQYIFSSLLTTSVVIIMLIITVITKDMLLKYVSEDIYNILIVGFCGGVGAFLSTMIRAKNYESEIISSKGVHRLDGFLRVIYGVIAGIIISLGIKSNIIFGFIKDANKNNFIEPFIGIIGGSSEIILPNIIKKIEPKV